MNDSIHNKRVAAGLLVALFSSTALAQLAPAELSERFAACGRISPGDERLQCFDTISADMKGPAEVATSAAVEEIETVAEPAMEAVASAAEEPAAAAPTVAETDAAAQAAAAAALGARHVEKPSEREAETSKGVLVTVVAVNTDALGRLVFKFDNGQVWQQRERKRVSIPDDYPQSAIVKSGFWGSLSLKFDQGSKVAVKRIK
jgi:hypothetical protein